VTHEFPEQQQEREIEAAQMSEIDLAYHNISFPS
jgi:hypothetical protein